MCDFSDLLKLTQSGNEPGSMMYSALWTKPWEATPGKDSINSRCPFWAAMDNRLKSSGCQCRCSWLSIWSVFHYEAGQPEMAQEECGGGDHAGGGAGRMYPR